MWLLLHAALLLPAIMAMPAGNFAKTAAFSASVDTSAAKPLISFDNGGVGVNFGGYSASAGLDGGLHAEAGTPYGQQAGAGLGGEVDGNGNAAGYNIQYAKGVILFDPWPVNKRDEPQTTVIPKESEVETLT